MDGHILIRADAQKDRGGRTPRTLKKAKKRIAEVHAKRDTNQTI